MRRITMKVGLSFLLLASGCGALGPAEFNTKALVLKRYGLPCQTQLVQSFPPTERLTYHVVLDSAGDIRAVPCPDSYEYIWHVTLMDGVVVKDWADAD